MGEFKKGDRVKFRTTTSQWWVGTVSMDESNGAVAIRYDQGLAAVPTANVKKVSQSLEHQLLPDTSLEDSRRIIEEAKKRWEEKKQ